MIPHTVLLMAATILAGCQTIDRVDAAAKAPTELHVFTSGGFSAAFDVLASNYERETGVHIVTGHGPSMGETPQAIPNRLARREPADVVILARSALNSLAKGGSIVPRSETDLVLSKIAVAVKEGAPAPDIGTAASVRSALLSAKTVAWSDSASGVYIQSTMLDKLGVAEQVRPKGRMIPATPVGEIVARGEAEIGFQQLSELKAVKGIHIVGLLPDDLQKVTAFSAGVVSYSDHPKEARALIDYLASSKAHAAIRESGLEPASQKVQP
jgi:molybdate transport system substrate-binding protein